MRSSLSRKGNFWDNAPTESLWGRLKVGRPYGRRFATRREAMDYVIDWLTFYNHKRLHYSDYSRYPDLNLGSDISSKAGRSMSDRNTDPVAERWLSSK